MSTAEGTPQGVKGRMAASKERGPLSFDYALDANRHHENIDCRSDHYMYARYGISDNFLYDGGHADYHQVTDGAVHRLKPVGAGERIHCGPGDQGSEPG